MPPFASVLKERESPMPFVRMDPEGFDEMMEELAPDDLPPGALDRPSGAFEYESAEAQRKPEKLSHLARMALDALVGLGATAFRVRYDGGHDEGFTHPDSIQFGDTSRPVERVVAELATPPFVSQLLATATEKGGHYGNAADLYREADAQTAVRYVLDELAYAYASAILGDGFGTGEYELYGAFTADLRTGEIVDDPNASNTPQSR
jgi:hypothetical protein